jgi:hypothetical protein
MNNLLNKSDKVLNQVSIKELGLVLGKNGFKVIVLNSEKEVKDFINTLLPDASIVGLGDSITTCKLNIRNLLYSKGSIIYYSWDGSENYNRSLDTFETPQRPEYYITRLTVLTSSGEILLKDYSKLASEHEIFPAHVLAFAGMNRVVDKFDDRESIYKYPIIKQCPSSIEFTVVLLPFLDY